MREVDGDHLKTGCFFPAKLLSRCRRYILFCNVYMQSRVRMLRRRAAMCFNNRQAKLGQMLYIPGVCNVRSIQVRSFGIGLMDAKSNILDHLTNAQKMLCLSI